MAHEPTDPHAPVQEDPSSAPTIYIGTVGLLLTAIAVLGTHWIYYAVDAGIEAEVFARPVVIFEEQKAAQEERVTRYRWVVKDEDPAKNVVGIPVEDAMRDIVEKYGK